MELAGYRPQLDGLRAGAVLAVLYTHFWGGLGPSTGSLGVRLFFVLSGFLISGILLDAKAAPRARIRNFYVRRALRLLPAFYLLLVAMVLVDSGGIRQVALWHALYASNILFAWRSDYVPWFTATWWTLEVEEQFYIIWRLLVAAASRRALGWTCLLLLPASLAWRAVAAVQGVSQWSALLLPASIDALAAGALLALAHRPSHRWLHWLAPAGWLASLALGVAWAAGHQLDFWAPTLQIPILVGLVHGAHTGLGGMARHILQARPVTYLGRISYGIYLSHLPLHFLITPHLGVLIPSKGWLMFPVLTAASIMVASLSWHALERPFHRLKSRFPFPEQPVPAPPQPLATAERVH